MDNSEPNDFNQVEKLNIKSNIKIFKGYDKNNKPFTAIVLLTEDKLTQINIELKEERLNLKKYNIIYKQIGMI